LHGATEERSKDLVQVSNQGVLVAGGVVGRHVGHQGGGSTTVEEADGLGFSVDVGAHQATVKVLAKVKGMGDGQLQD